MASVNPIMGPDGSETAAMAPEPEGSAMTVSKDAEGKEEQRSTWFELFADLVFVAAIGHVTHIVAPSFGWDNSWRFLGALLVVWLAWVAFTFYWELFGKDTPSHRIWMLTGIFATLLLAGTAERAFSHEDRLFVASYAAYQVVLLIQYGRAWRAHPSTRPLVRRLMTGFGLGLLVWCAGLVVPAPWSLVCFALGLAIQVLTPVLSRREVLASRLSPTHFPERFGLFMLIVIGEMVLLVADTVSHASTANALFAALAAFAFAGSVWWTYFDFIARKPSRAQLQRAGLSFIFLHFPLTVGIILAGVGAGRTLEAVNAGLSTVPLDALWALCGGAALYHGAFTLLNFRLGGWYPAEVSGLKFMAFILSGIVGAWLLPMTVLLLVVGVMVVGIIAGHRARPREIL